MSPRGGYDPSETSAVCSRCMRSGRVHGQGFAGGRKAQRAELGGSCKGSWAGQGGNTQIEAQCIPTSHGRSIADANALPGVLHAIAQRRPRAHFRAGDDTAELAILPPPRDRDRSRVGALYVGNLSVLGGLSRKLVSKSDASTRSLPDLVADPLNSCGPLTRAVGSTARVSRPRQLKTASRCDSCSGNPSRPLQAQRLRRHGGVR